MKKKFIFLILLFGFFLFPKSAFASNDVSFLQPVSFEYINPDDVYREGSIIGYNYDGQDYYGNFYKFSVSFKAFLFKFQGLEKNKHYKLQFNFLSYPFYSDVLNPYVVSIHTTDGTFSCKAQSNFDSSYGTLTTTGKGGKTAFTTVTCDDFYMSTEWFEVVINGLFSVSDQFTSRWGISKLTATVIPGYETNSAIDKNTDATNKQTETIKDSDTTEASDSANSFFGDFESSDYGLSDIVTMPLEFIKKMSSSTCNSLEFPVPFVNQNVALPCMSSIYKKYFSAFLTLYQIITTGLIAYWCCVNMFRLVQNFKNPDNDEVEVLDL